MHILLEQVPSPQLQMLVTLVTEEWGPYSMLSCCILPADLGRENGWAAQELLWQGPALPAKGELIGTAPTPALAHARQHNHALKAAPRESPHNYIVSC